MGMYNYINKNGDQVKCFYVPCISIHENEETHQKEVVYHTSGGKLESFARAPVPSRTLYYNYGDTFAIMEYRLLLSDEEPRVHIIRDRRYIETICIRDLPDDYDLPNNIIDKYGQWYYINNAKDMKLFIEENTRTTRQADETEESELAKVGLKRALPNFDKTRTAESYIEEFKIRDKIKESVYLEINKPFADRWLNYEHESSLDIIGLVLSDYEDIQRHPQERAKRSEEDWVLIFSQAIELLKKEGFPTPLNNYFQWCEKEGIKVNRETSSNLFKKYTGGQEY